MRILLGMILGALITVGAAFEGHAPMVNWDVVSHNWDGMKLQLRDVAVDIEKGRKRITG
jgi:hypothetical protein